MSPRSKKSPSAPPEAGAPLADRTVEEILASAPSEEELLRRQDAAIAQFLEREDKYIAELLASLPQFTEKDVAYLRGVCPAPEFLQSCTAALHLAAHHHKGDAARGQATNPKKRIKQLEREFEAANLLCERHFSIPDSERVLRLIRQELYVELERARKSPKKSGKNALNVAAVQVVDTFRQRGLPVDASRRDSGAVAVLKLICERADMPLSFSSYKAAILRVRG
jgi:hypothetical protein